MRRLSADPRSAVVDLTHPIEPTMPVSVGFPPVEQDLFLDRRAGDVATVEILKLSLHTGTHVDAPAHFVDGGETIDALDPLALCGSAVVVDVTDLGPWEAVEARHLVAWEERSGERISSGDIVLLRSGYGRHWRPLPEGADYMTRGWPYLGGSAIDLLLERRVRALGVECPDPDRVDQRDLASATFECHRRLLGAGIPIIENLTRLDRIPVPRLDFAALPLAIRGASGSPVRALAFLPPA